MKTLSEILPVLIITVFNVPVLIILISLPFIADLRKALKEKNAIGGAEDSTSYSRVTGLVGAVIVTSFFWAIGNIIIYKAFTQVSDIKLITESVGRFFLVGSALFLPYAFNQLKTVFGAAGLGPSTVATPGAPPVTATMKGHALNLVVANLSTSIDDPTFAAAVAAVGVQVARDFQPEWGSGATLSATRLALNGGQAGVNTALDAIIYVGDSSTDPTTGVAGVYGYHSQNYGQTPYAFVYLDVCAQYGEAWSCTLSHEVLELLADPTSVLTATGPAPAGVGAPGQTVDYDLEICDPTQGDSYIINNTAVSNFVTKTYFGMAGGSAATNFLNLSLSPFGARPGGYLQYEDSGGAHQVNGAKIDARRLAARAMLAGYRRNARREAAMRYRL
jgi:hypothetical protein